MLKSLVRIQPAPQKSYQNDMKKRIKQLNKILAKLEREYVISKYSLREDVRIKEQIDALYETIEIMKNMRP